MRLSPTFTNFATAIVIGCGVFASRGIGADTAAATTVEIHFAQHRFSPAKLEVPARTALTIKVVNDSQERIEFESFKLNREKVVDAGQTLTLHIAPLAPGSYDFYDDFHQDVPEGAITAK